MMFSHTCGIPNPLNHPKRISLGENLSDAGGLKLAKEAYKIWQNKQRNNRIADEKPLRLEGGISNHLGEPFTVDQLFYIAYAQIWCENYKPDALRYMLNADSHLPGEARVRGTVSLQRGFREAMKCKVGDEMVASTQCNIW